MRTRIAAAVVAATAVVALAACSSKGGDDKPMATATTVSAPAATTTDAAVPALPPAPTGAERVAYLAAIKSVDPALVADPDKAVQAGRNQCQAINGGAADPNHLAAERFGNDARPLTDTQGAAINAALRLTICPKD